MDQKSTLDEAARLLEIREAELAKEASSGAGGQKVFDKLAKEYADLHRDHDACAQSVREVIKTATGRGIRVSNFAGIGMADGGDPRNMLVMSNLPSAKRRLKVLEYVMTQVKDPFLVLKSVFHEHRGFPDHEIKRLVSEGAIPDPADIDKFLDSLRAQIPPQVSDNDMEIISVPQPQQHPGAGVRIMESAKARTAGKAT